MGVADVEALERAQKLDPTDPRVRANLDELREFEKKPQADAGTPRDTAGGPKAAPSNTIGK